MNAFFDGYVHAKTNLKEFVDQFDNALRKKIENENAVDFYSFNIAIPVISPSPLEKTFQNIYTCNKFREVQKEVMGMLASLPTLHRKDGVIATYHVEDEVDIDDFIKEVTHTVYFNEVECKLDIVDERPEVSRYSRIIKRCYQVATNAASSDEHTDDMLAKLDAMNLGYLNNKPSHQTCSNIAVTNAVTTTTESSKKVLSPLVVRGKGRPPSLRKKSMIERVKPTTKKATQKGKRKQPHGREGEVVGTCRNLFGQLVIGTQQSVAVQPPQNTTDDIHFSSTELGVAMIETQESVNHLV
ncbi:uncharacterized protein LOC122296900 [Carya illinoinensis]|uniref:uncharacterized protein LOC122296900 n=1 Tax=Carya illinoinensis TaxID=32201 RepID=UPI001C727CAC|nr:uncharacterized protein LOC122296900 [Carya illinoinensis]